MTRESESSKSKPKTANTQLKPELGSSRKSNITDAISVALDLIPKDMRVIGLSGADGEPDRQVILLLHKAKKSCGRHIFIPVENFVIADTRALKKEFVKHGYYDLPAESRDIKLFAKSIMKLAKLNDVIIFTKSGLNTVTIQGDVFTAYAWGNEAYWFGAKPAKKVLVINSTPPSKTAGTHEDWLDSVGNQMHDNPYMIVAICHALSAAIRGAFKQPYTTIALVGNSGVGKSTTQQCVQSLIGSIDEVATMVGSEAGLTAALADQNDRPVCFQDTRQVKNSQIFLGLLFSSADGAKRMVIGAKDGKLAATMILSNERLLADMPNTKGSLDEGIYARFFEIYCNAEYGVFHNLHNAPSAADFAKSITADCSKYYGVMWPAWIQELSENWDEVLELHKKWIPKIKSKIVKRVGEVAEDRVTNRILDALTFSAWSGCIARKLGLLTVSNDEIVDAFTLVLTEYIARQASGATPLGDQVIAEVRGCLDVNVGNFPDLKSFNDPNPRAGILGYRTGTKKYGELFLFFPTEFTKLFIDKFGTVAYEHLAKANYLITTGSRNNQFQIRIPETQERKSFIAIRNSIRYDG